MKYRRIVAIIMIFLLAAGMIVTMSGCGKGSEESKATPPAGRNTEAEPTGSTADDQSDGKEVPDSGDTGAVEDFHLTIEEAQENAGKINARSFLQPDGIMLCDNENLEYWAKAMAATGGKIKRIHSGCYIDEDDHVYGNSEFALYDGAEIAWFCFEEISAAVTTDHELLMNRDPSSYYRKVPEIHDAVMADEADKVVAVLHTDGTVTTYSIETDANPSQYDWDIDLSCLTDIVQMQICVMFPMNEEDDMIPLIIGLKRDGTMVSTANYPEEIAEWSDIVGFKLDETGVVGWKGDGTLVACGKYIFNTLPKESISEYRHIRYFEIGRGDNISAVSDDGYAIGEIRFAPYHVLTDGSYDFNDYDPMPDYEEWREEANKN